MTDAQPVPPAARITALDAARGLALFGIFCVNIQLFCQPFGLMIEPPPPGGWWDSGARLFVRLLCEGKFYPLFSALFGIGLVLQMGRVRAAGKSFGALYSRRLIVLALMGVAHALLLWYGDILFMYAFAGAILLLCSRWSGAALMRTGIILACVATLLVAGFMALTATGAAAPAHNPAPMPGSGVATDESAFFEQGAGDHNPAESPPPDSDFDRTPFGRLMAGFQSGAVQQPQDSLWVETELEAYRDGPYLQVFLFRAMTWLMILFLTVLNFGWHVLAMFFIGAGLMKRGLFDPDRAQTPRRLFLLGLLLGLPLSLAGAALHRPGASAGAMALSALLATPGSTLLALGYLGGITVLARSGRAAWLIRSFARVGRLALTNYLMQTVIATSVFYYYGLGLFGELSAAEQLGLVVIVYAGQHLFSWAWLSIATIGPMEWFWRTLTYLRPPRFARDHPPRAAG